MSLRKWIAFRPHPTWLARLGAMALAATIVTLPSLARAQGLLVVVDPAQEVRLPRPIIIVPPPHPPRPPRPVPPPSPPTYKIAELKVEGRIADQVAQIQVSQTFVNTGSREMEVSFIFPLPYDGAIDSLTLLVDGKEFPGRLMDAKEARRVYEEIVRKNRDPALLEWLGTGMFQTSVFPVPAGASRTVTLRYSQLCRQFEGLTDFLFPLSTAKYTAEPVEKLEIRLSIESGEEIRNVYSPTHPVEIQRPDKRRAVVVLRREKETPQSDFRLLYDVGTDPVAARVVSYRPDKDEDGYFVLLATPQIPSAEEKPPPKTVVFVVDRSGSMSGKKIEQARGAARFILQNLREGDLFNIIAYDSRIESFRPELERYDDESRRAALGFIEGIFAGGMTDIDGALEAALGQLTDTERPSYVVFLTDGLPTVGERNEGKIVANAAQRNKVRARVFVFGVGYDVNSRLLERLARDSFGQTEYVRPEEDIEERVARLYRRIEAPVMTDAAVEFALDLPPEAGPVVSRLYPKAPFDLFAGEQLVLVGRYRHAGAAKVLVSGKLGGEEKRFEYPVELVEHSGDDTNAFAEKLWAVRRIGEILDEIDLVGKNEELIEELVALATRHGVLTPYTSFLADENTDVRDLAGNVRRAESRLMALDVVEGQFGVAQRAYRGELQRAAQADYSYAGVPLAVEAAAGMGGYAMPAPAAGPVRTPARAGSGYPGGGGMGGYGGGMGAPGAAYGHDVYGAESATRELAGAEQNVRHVGNRAFYRREGQWVDATVTEEQQQRARPVRQFSDEYFALARRHGRELAQYLVFDEPVVLNVGRETYLIEP